MARATRFALPERFPTLNNTLTSGITKTDPSLPIAKLVEQFTPDGIRHRTVVDVNKLVKAQGAVDAALAFGEHIMTLPAGLIRPVGGYVVLVSTTATGLAATAGEVGLGTTIASGAVATLGGTAGFEDLMEGTTLSNHVAATELTSRKANLAPIQVGTLATHGVQILDGSSTAIKVYLNLASTWDQTSAESVTFEARIILDWEYVGVGNEVPVVA